MQNENVFTLSRHEKPDASSFSDILCEMKPFRIREPMCLREFFAANKLILESCCCNKKLRPYQKKQSNCHDVDEWGPRTLRINDTSAGNPNWTQAQRVPNTETTGVPLVPLVGIPLRDGRKCSYPGTRIRLFGKWQTATFCAISVLDAFWLCPTKEIRFCLPMTRYVIQV